jgi:hypothetical protein
LAVHAASLSIPVDEPVVNEFFVPSAFANRQKAAFWICPKVSEQVAAGIVVSVVAAGHEHKFIISSVLRVIYSTGTHN